MFKKCAIEQDDQQENGQKICGFDRIHHFEWLVFFWRMAIIILLNERPLILIFVSSLYMPQFIIVNRSNVKISLNYANFPMARMH